MQYLTPFAAAAPVDATHAARTSPINHVCGVQKEGRTQQEAEALEDGFARLVAGMDYHPQGMGDTYKVMALVPYACKTPIPFGPEYSPSPAGQVR